MKRSTFAWTMLAAIAVGGCATQPIPLTPESKQRVGNAEVILEIPQSEIFADVKSSDLAKSAGGGAILAAIDLAVESSRSKDAEKEVEPLRKILSDYDFSGKLKQAFEQAAAGLSWLNRVSIDVDRSPDGQLLRERLKSSSSNSVFVVKTRYSFAPYLTNVLVKAHARIVPIKSNDARPLYSQEFTINESMPASQEGAPADIWTRDNGKWLRAALDNAITLLAQEIAEDVDGRHKADAKQ